VERWALGYYLQWLRMTEGERARSLAHARRAAAGMDPGRASKRAADLAVAMMERELSVCVACGEVAHPREVLCDRCWYRLRDARRRREALREVAAA
jgi:uncharacterized paraquat-inducible protein A